ncbi:MAG TPA: MlaD family protein [Streptosporangiaceae bacterium]|jgi:phospholipid/cholesterol/gamma-HCH transport system substrate-binding protein|nr:MlaD family protein [Streptosporangiaceae bacterium]
MRGLLIKVLALVLVTAVTGTLLVALFDNLQVQKQHTYRALFTDVSGLATGDDVRAAGVVVGRVNSLALQGNNDVLVSFTASDAVPVTRSTTLTVRYKDLVGNRYLEINPPTAPASPLPDGGVIPPSHTQPALSLDALFNGFQPLFQGLQPAQINQLSAELITVLQGEGGTIDSLLASIGSLTSALANRDEVIGQVIGNLNSVLGTVSQHDNQLSYLVVQLQQLISGLAADRGPIGQSFGRIAGLAGTLAGLLNTARPDISGTVQAVNRLASVLNSNAGQLNSQLQALPGRYQLLNREGIYGSFFNFYLCGVQLRFTGPTGAPVSTPMFQNEVQRCRS